MSSSHDNDKDDKGERARKRARLNDDGRSSHGGGRAVTKQTNTAVFAGVKILIAQTYPAATVARMARTLTDHGARVVAAPARGVAFLVQSHVDDCDERIERCVALGIVAVPFAYLEACASRGEVVPFRHWAAAAGDGGDGDAGDDYRFYLNPRADPGLGQAMAGASSSSSSSSSSKCILGTTALGNVDPRARESEEVNQSLHDYLRQPHPAADGRIGWPRPGDDGGRSVIYLLPIATTQQHNNKHRKAKKKKKGRRRAKGGAAATQLPTSITAETTALLDASDQFLRAYFGCSSNSDEQQQQQQQQQQQGAGAGAGAGAGTGAGAAPAARVAAVRVLPVVELQLGNPTPARAALLGVGIRSKKGTAADGSDARLWNVLDLLDAVATKLPDDGYCILGLTDREIYEHADALDGSLRGRAFGGSRIAVFSTAHYARERASGRVPACQALAYQLGTLAHETLHCFGLDHCGLYTCLMNSWSDAVSEFAPPPPSRRQRRMRWDGDVVGCVHLCPVCVRKLAACCGGFAAGGSGLRGRYAALEACYTRLGLEDQAAWCAAVMRAGDEVRASNKKQ